jgi:hypothetical protein
MPGYRSGTPVVGSLALRLRCQNLLRRIAIRPLPVADDGALLAYAGRVDPGQQHATSRSLRPHRSISHGLPLAEAAKGYKLFEAKEDNCRNVVLHP